MQPVRFVVDGFLAQLGHMYGWVPVFLALGIGAYFSLRIEPQNVHWWGLFAAALCVSFAGLFINANFRPVLIALLLVAVGFGIAKARTEALRGPVLEFRYYGPIQGRVVNIDRSASEAVRLTLDRVVLSNVAPLKTPSRVRVSLHGTQPLTDIAPGDTLVMTGHLSPPSGPAEPGGFDFQRHAWFLQLGGVGYTRTPALRLLPPEGDPALALFKLRVGLAAQLEEQMPPDTAGIAAAITTGDRSSIPTETLENLRAANLAHLLAISGLHMGLLTGFIFGLLRLVLALMPNLSLRWPNKKIAAVGALCVGAGYLALSGGNVATQRAFVMVAVMFIAILFDRRALTLRAVAIAAVIVLLLRPEALMSPGFQMSFAATTALVFAFGQIRDWELGPKTRWVRGAMQVVVSSGVAGLATAPFAAAHFNQIAHFGLIANVLSVPVMGTVVMPSAVLAACLAPLGLEWVGLWLMDIGLRWILMIAEWTASQPGAVGHVIAPTDWVLPILALGGLHLVLWQGRLRLAGVAVVATAFWLWSGTERPTVLVADTGGFIGLMTQEGRDLSRATGHGFVSEIWLENDGAPVEQDTASRRDGIDVSGRLFRAEVGRWRILQVSGKTALADLVGCGGADVLISNQRIEGDRPCLTFDTADLRYLGALAISVQQDHLVVTSSRHVTGHRPWNVPRVSNFPTEFILN